MTVATLDPPAVHPCATINAEYAARVAIELNSAAAELRALADWLPGATVPELTDRYAPVVVVEQLDTAEWPAPAELQDESLKLPERVGGWTPPPAVFDRETALDAMKRNATPMAMRPDPIAQLAPAVLDQPDPDGPLTAETEAWIGQGPADDDMPGRTEPARPSLFDRWMGWLSDSGSRIENRLRAVGEDRRQG